MRKFAKISNLRNIYQRSRVFPHLCGEICHCVTHEIMRKAVKVNTTSKHSMI